MCPVVRKRQGADYSRYIASIDEGCYKSDADVRYALKVSLNAA